MQLINQGSKEKDIFFLIITLLALLFLPPELFAGETGGGLPYEDGLIMLKDSITGPYALVASIVGIVVCASALILAGSEINGFFKTLIVVILVISVLVGAENLVNLLGGTGAEITAYDDKKDTLLAYF